MYLFWCLVAFCLYLWLLIYRLCESPAKIINMGKIHRYYEIRNWNYKDICPSEYTKPTKLKTFLICTWKLFLNTILSWIYIIITIISFAISYFKKNEFPKKITEKMKEYDLKLSVSELQKKEVQHIIKEQYQLLWADNETTFAHLKNIAITWEEYLDYVYVMNKNERSESVSIIDDLLIYDFSNPSGRTESITKYKIEWESLEQILLQETECDYYNWFKKIITVKNWKINENEIEEPKEYRINNLKESIQWHKWDNRILVKALIFIHESPITSWKNYIEQRLKEVEKTKEEFIWLCKSYWFEPSYEKDWSFKFFYKSPIDRDGNAFMSDEQYEKFEEDKNKLINKYWVDIRNIPLINESLEKMLEKITKNI